MAFNRKNLSGGIGAGSTAPILFTYVDLGNTKVAVGASGYFTELENKFKENDIILTICSDGGQTLQITSARGVTPITTATM